MGDKMSDKEKKGPATPEEKGVYLFMEEVSQETCKELISFILTKSFQRPRPKCLQIIINSPGGDLNAAFAVIDVMNGCPFPVHTVGLGQIASAGFMMFINGAKGHRLLTPNTSIMSHQWSWGAWGKEHELMAQSKEFELTSERMMNHYKKCTGMSEKKIREYLLPATDVWLSAKESKKLGICDKIKEFK
jgi:ATP-dependent Clp protease protease subunit